MVYTDSISVKRRRDRGLTAPMPLHTERCCNEIYEYC